ncbi:metal ABC transporter solute-binding protein, Zn/Mn family [Haloimpatiens lingqiaonensis]|uniref:metal ABC transporter solute-binding protein, Zn/Mn family n=1 Tax=Haloimpatiens lingqiaonensis TaxID=1380675 RepID=UPI0037BFE729
MDILVSNKFLYDCVKKIDKGIHKVDYIFNKKGEQIYVNYYYDISYVPDIFIYDEFNFSNLNNSYISRIEGNKVGIINSSRGANPLSYYKNVDKYGKGEECIFWNNIDNYKVVLVNVKNAIVERDPLNRSYYEKNFKESLKELEDYEKIFKKQGEGVKEHLFIVEGNSLDYIMAYSGLKTVSIDENIEKSKELDLNKIIEEKYEKNKDKMVLVYFSNDFLSKNKEFIAKYGVKCVKVSNFNISAEYDKVLDYEKKLFSTLVNICTK